MRYPMFLLCFVALAVSPAFAGCLTFTGPGSFGLQIVSTAPLLAGPTGATVSGTISLSPAEALRQGLSATFYLDNEAKLVSELDRPTFSVDTTQLSEGRHEVRMDVNDGALLAFSTGTIPLHVLREISVNALRQNPDGANAFGKVQRKVIMREIVWFNQREADLEKHAFITGGRVFITLSDLLRHVGGTILWGPSKSYVMVERNGVKMRFIPGSSTVYVNGQKHSLGQATTRIENRLFVPIRPVLSLLDTKTDWNRLQGRAFVDTR